MPANSPPLLGHDVPSRAGAWPYGGSILKVLKTWLNIGQAYKGIDYTDQRVVTVVKCGWPHRASEFAQLLVCVRIFLAFALQGE